MVIACFGLFLALHLLLYVTTLRHLRSFQQERVIFLYHFASFALLFGVSLGRLAVVQDQKSLLDMIFVFAVHGIYSLSFLELWSLAQGGYSLRILMELEATRAGNSQPDLEQFTRIGDAKKNDRLGGLRKLRLIRDRGDAVALTSFGFLVAVLLSTIAWLANVRNEG